jgi:hypothetical protein
MIAASRRQVGTVGVPPCTIKRHTICPVQVGEFAFVLLSLATSSGLISSRLSMFLLGVTAFSLLTTPIVFSLAHYVLPRETAACLPLASPQVKHHHAQFDAHLPYHGHFRRKRASSGPPSSQHGSTNNLRVRANGICERVAPAGDDALSPWVGLDAGAPGHDARGELPVSVPALACGGARQRVGTADVTDSLLRSSSGCEHAAVEAGHGGSRGRDASQVEAGLRRARSSQGHLGAAIERRALDNEAVG